ncbi:MAG TPA: potassium-transporting ATPase subunit KdpA, partial [Deinococcales bacterium]|nr:potassium-transporting ATPase subunit KdpA [Deinococcales bacterium]
GPNSAMPLENPTPLSNLLEMISILLIPVAEVLAAGFFLRQWRFGALLLVVTTLVSVALVAGAIAAERAPNPAFAGLAAAGPNLEGKEVRFGADATAAWASFATQTSNGSVNGMLDSFSPLGGLVPLTGMLLNDIYGGWGVGLINLFLFVIVTVFIAGLMVGRTPELWGRKIEAREVKFASIALLLQPLLILGFAAVALGLPGGPGNSNPGNHGLTQVLYEYTSAFANNGSGLAGLGNSTMWWNVSCAAVLVVARFVPILAPLAIAGSLAVKKVAPVTSGSLRVDTGVFAATLLAVMVIFQLLNFGPALVLGPVGEQLALASPNAVHASLPPALGGAR